MNKEEVKIDCSSCLAFGMHCPHIVNGDPYYYNCTLTIAVLEKENVKLCKDRDRWMQVDKEDCDNWRKDKEQLNKAKEVIEGLMRFCRCFAQHHTEDIRYKEAEQFLKEMEDGN